MTVEFVGIGAVNSSSEIGVSAGPLLDVDYAVELARVHERSGWDRVLFLYGSGAPDPSIIATHVASRTETLEVMVAHRPNVSSPTYAAKVFATLDRISDGRFMVHFVTGGNDREQRREGDGLAKDDRYRRTREYIDILVRAWTSETPFDHDGEFYSFEGFHSDIRPVRPRGPRISFGGSSPAAFEAGGAVADVYCLLGESLERTREQIAAVRAAATAAGRAEAPRIQVGIRPIIAPTEAAAWEKAHGIVAAIARNTSEGGALRYAVSGRPENTGSRRLLDLANSGDRFDRALWTAPAAVSGAIGNSTALVGTPETVAAALLDYYDIGVRAFNTHGYSLLEDTEAFGRYVIPLVREEVAKREAAVSFT